MPYDTERVALDQLAYIHHLKVLALDVTGWSPGWAEVSLLGVRLYDLLEALPPDLICRYVAYKEGMEGIEGERWFEAKDRPKKEDT